ncbi:MAG: TonB-dependent receptor [Pedobacter sp.]|nr:MAG: TonB-dependent receptor [Pedobacter sp.]
MTKIKLYKCWKTMLGLTLFGLIFSTSVFAQVSIKGKVTDEKGLPLPGAGVAVKNTTTSTLTNSNGEFTLSASAANPTLVVSFVGYLKKEVVANSANLVIAMTPDAEVLGEVIIVGYGTQKKSDVTGAVASIKGENLREVPMANVVSALQGRVAGVDISANSSRPGAGGQIRIRGNRSLSAGNDPLLVVDGIPYGGSVNDINNDDIASVDILKDASSTAIYGSRGSNGVILITTKRGRVSKPTLSYNSWYGVSEARAQYDMFNGAEFVAFRDAAFPAYTGGYSPLELQGIADGTSTNWQDHLYKRGSTTSHELGVNGGAEGVSYNLSTGYFKDDGIIEGQSFERFSLSASVDATINKFIKLGITSRNTLAYNNGDGVNPVYNTLRITPLVSAFNPDGSMRMFPQAGTVDETATANPLTLYDRDNIVDRRRRIRTFNNAYLEAQILKNLKYRFNLGLDFSQEQRGTFYGPNTIQRPSAATVANASASTDNAENWRATLENLLYYNFTVANDHRFDLTGLWSTQYDRGFSNGFTAVGFPSGSNQYYQFNLALGPITTTGNNGFGRGRLQSFMGRLNYAYKDRYLATATFRRDGSSVFPENQYLNYSAYALGWNIINEEFMKEQTTFSGLKIRASYGTTGNQGIPGNATRGTLGSNRYNYGTENVQGYFISSLPNAGLQWEATKQMNLALDFGFFQNRITGSIDFYKQNTDNIILQKALPRSEGANNYYENVGKTSGRGIDFSLSTINIQGKDDRSFGWSTDFNFNVNREKIVELGDPNTLQDVGNGWFVGQPMNVIYDYTKLGIWQTHEAVEAARFNTTPGNIKIADINGDGQITSLDRSIIGTFQPKMTLGMTQRFTYKGFDLSAVAFSRLGNKLVAPYLTTDPTGTGYFALLNGRVNQPQVDYWTPTNPTNAFPRPQGGTASIAYSRTLSYFDGSFVKIRSINLGYTFKSESVKKAGFSSLRVYATALNPFILYSPFVRSGLGLDPEGNGTGGTIGSGNDAAVNNDRAITVGLNTPTTRQFLFGINARF